MYKNIYWKCMQNIQWMMLFANETFQDEQKKLLAKLAIVVQLNLM